MRQTAPRDNCVLSPATETTSIAFPFAGVAPGNYLVFATVDGAESHLSLDGSGQFVAPTVTVT
jgi:hypothetical protein